MRQSPSHRRLCVPIGAGFLIATALAACTFGDWGGDAGDQWSKPGADADQIAADREACEELARDETATDRAIAQDITANRPLSAGAPIMPEAGAASADRRRYREIVAACMSELGYSRTP